MVYPKSQLTKVCTCVCVCVCVCVYVTRASVHPIHTCVCARGTRGMCFLSLILDYL